MRKQKLLRKLSRSVSIMVQAGLSRTTRRCGNKGCICHRDPARRHGPHLYMTFHRGDKSRSLYVPPEHAAEARKAHAAWAAFWQIGSAIAAINREKLRQRWERKKTAETADKLLEDENLLERVYEAQGVRHPRSRNLGRTQTPAEVVLRLLVLKHVRNWSYQTLEREVRANLVFGRSRGLEPRRCRTPRRWDGWGRFSVRK